MLLLLSNGFEALEAAAFTDVLGWSAEEGGPVVEVVSCGRTDIVTCTWGFSVKPHITLDGISPENFDALAIPGGFQEAGFYKDAYSDEFKNIIIEFNKIKKPIASVCVGALALGNSGILKGRNATTYRLNGIRLKELENFGAKISNDIIVKDGNITTSSAPSTATEVAFKLLEELTSFENMSRVKNLMGF